MPDTGLDLGGDVVFSKIGGMFRKAGDGGEDECVRVFESHHIEADRVGPALCVTVRCESVTDREASIIANETEGLIDGSFRSLVMDLTHVGVLTSAGIGTLVRTHKAMEGHKGRLVVCSLSEELDELFRLTRLDRLFTIAPDRAHALDQTK